MGEQERGIGACVDLVLTATTRSVLRRFNSKACRSTRHCAEWDWRDERSNCATRCTAIELTPSTEWPLHCATSWPRRSSGQRPEQMCRSHSVSVARSGIRARLVRQDGHRDDEPRGSLVLDLPRLTAGWAEAWPRCRPSHWVTSFQVASAIGGLRFHSLPESATQTPRTRRPRFCGDIKFFLGSWPAEKRSSAGHGLV